MSVILEDNSGDIILMTKGADSVIKERLNEGRSLAVKETM
jgi:magnesium-transporting ATPase (P-type)